MEYLFDKKVRLRKYGAVGLIACVMLSLVYAYEVRGAPINRAVHTAVNALSLDRAYGEWSVGRAYERYAAAHPAAAPVTGDASSVPVLLYHGIVRERDRFNLSADAFKDQMFALKQAGYRTVTMDDFIAYMKDGKPLPAKSFLLTFDDGRRDSYANADPVLKALGFRATMFVASGPSLESNHESYYISSNDIRDMIESGRWDIGSHAVQETGGTVEIEGGAKGNFLSSRAWSPTARRLETEEEYAARVAREIRDSKAALEEALGIRIASFAYPFGDYGQQGADPAAAIATVEAAMAGTYDVAFRQVWPNDGEYNLNDRDSARLRLKRIETPTDWTGQQLVRYLDNAAAKSLAHHDDLTSDAGWMNIWGDVRHVDGRIHLDATATSTGAAAFLDGTKAWDDYVYTAKVDRVAGTHVSLMTRYADGQNYLVCTFGEGRAKIESVVNGTSVKLAEAKYEYDLPARGAVLGARVQGDAMECLVGAMNVVSATGTVPIRSGGVGLRVWDRQFGTAKARLDAITVLPIGPR